MFILAALLTGVAAARYVNAHVTVENTTLRFRDRAPDMGLDWIADLWSPTRNADGTESFYPVTSKWQQPRSEGTTPHQGVDLGTPIDTDLYPIEEGWIVYQSGFGPDGVTSFPDANGAVNWEIVIRVDWNYNGVQDDELYLKYDHVKRVGYVATGAFVSAATRIAKSGNEGGVYPGPHLHFGFLWPKEPGVNNGRWVRMYPFYTWAQDWQWGRDMDFIAQFSHGSGNVISLYAYTRVTAGPEALHPDSVVLYHRRTGTTTWTGTSMRVSEIDPYNFTLELNALGYAPATQIDYLVRAWRSFAGGDEHKAAYFPPEFAHPYNSPNHSATRYPFYAATIQ